METRKAYLEFHGADLVEDLAHVLTDHGPGDLVIALSGGLHGVPGQVVEGDHVGQDAYRLVEGTEPGDDEHVMQFGLISGCTSNYGKIFNGALYVTVQTCHKVCNRFAAGNHP